MKSIGSSKKVAGIDEAKKLAADYTKKSFAGDPETAWDQRWNQNISLSDHCSDPWASRTDQGSSINTAAGIILK